MNPKSPCKDCPNRKPGCHTSECEPWAEYEDAKRKLREAREEFMKTWCYESGRDRGRTQKLKARQRHRSIARN